MICTSPVHNLGPLVFLIYFVQRCNRSNAPRIKHCLSIAATLSVLDAIEVGGLKLKQKKPYVNILCSLNDFKCVTCKYVRKKQNNDSGTSSSFASWPLNFSPCLAAKTRHALFVDIVSRFIGFSSHPDRRHSNIQIHMRHNNFTQDPYHSFYTHKSCTSTISCITHHVS